MVVRVQLQASARYRAMAFDDDYTVTDEDVVFLSQEIELPEYPRVGDEIGWPSGRNVMVKQFTWMVDRNHDLPIVTVE